MVVDFFSSWAPLPVLNTIASFSFLTHFESIVEGVIDIRDLIFFLSLIAVWLAANAIVVELKKAG